jgi:ABC-2 type transport system ATP-binding protein
MNRDAELERGYRRWLRLYPKGFRSEHETELLGVLLDGARDGQRRPDPVECLDLLRAALRIHLRPRVPRWDRPARIAIRLMYLGAAVELAAAVVVLATAGQVRASLVRRHPDLTGTRWHAVVAGQLEPLALAAGIAVGLWLWMAWAHGRGHRWATPVFAGFFGLNTFGLLHGAGPGVGAVRQSGPGGRDRPLARAAGGGRARGPTGVRSAVQAWAQHPPTVRLGVTGRGGEPALSVDRLSKRFGDRMAFDDLSFAVGHGEVFGFLGPNGAGKTTTVRTLGTLIAPTSGSATVAGIPLVPENGVEIRQRISIMPESPGLYHRLSVTENLECFADLYEEPDSKDRIGSALRAVRLLDRAHDPCGLLSKGLRQRVALARALLSDPEVLFLDEPTSGLDPVAARDVHGLITALGRSGVTIFLTTHRLDEAERLCDRVAILNTTLRTIGRPDELRQRLFARTLTVRTLVPLPEPDRVFAGLEAVDGWRQDGAAGYVLTVSEPAVAAPGVTRALVASGADVLSIGESRHSLEDVYLELIDEAEAKPR